jgi:uncharacterized protein
VSIPKAPFQLNVGFIIHQTVGYSREFFFNYPNLLLPSDINLYNLDVKALVSRTTEGLLLQVRINTSTGATCSRCLEPFTLHLEVDFTELFFFRSHAKSDAEQIVPETGRIDLSPLINDYVVLELPINPTCREDCQGLCPICGESLNEKSCNHEAVSVDPRLAVLKTLLEE